MEELIINKYTAKEELIQNGIWKGELYRAPDRLASSNFNRGWLWKTLASSQYSESNETQEVTKDLLPVPLITEKHEEPSENKNVRDKIIDYKRIDKSFKSFKKGIRRLTPKETTKDPLLNNQSIALESDGDLSLPETLEIIDLDLSRLMLDDIFQRPKVYAQMRQILYNYLIISRNNTKGMNTTDFSSIQGKVFSYKQGYHELLGLIYLQLYHEMDLNKGNRNALSSLDGGKENYHGNEDVTLMRNCLNIFVKLMNQVAPTFYNEKQLIKWDETQFSQILKVCSPTLHALIYEKDQNGRKPHSNLIWLIRWTRLLLLRELPREKVLIIWDHLLTFVYPIDTLMACLIITLLLSLYDRFLALYTNDSDHDDIIELMLHFKDTQPIVDLDTVQLCQMAGNICELWYNGNLEDMQSICRSFIKLKTGLDETSPIDPHRLRLEDRLRKSVKKSLA
ncbi:GTPase-activating protein GYP6 NDAI_0C02250 [Naumovozyma dairenensis CBS 421]|uniref:Rab-GAP TBC domain-containing protein n=1 Tax=Naumovozyma dairenensis (strain ATCC 10597 / BCRC 20456 / CBS 421 / NBRC 0211 / NRRL Y-12639) TaxID=1071378 RepID=G0W7X4_NAUDC|nr:hypothetical protein NDAI_0C02250 [Naumovozyma dairenensis CBS 421]CCD23885.1 hypothetical protein NDAI_0C02250 [Naumovozyma dairenensis CBS 421]